ncbi:unnamed protein product, partial [Mesorhabditis spiculigera]
MAQLKRVGFLLALLGFAICQNAVNDVYMCDETNAQHNWYIYCQGPLLAAAQLHQTALGHNDSKYFVDMPLTKSPEETRDAYAKQFGNDTHAIDVEALKKFIAEHFAEPGNEMTECTPSDWTAKPASFDKIIDPDLKEFAYDLNDIWKTLCRQIKGDVNANPSQYSLLYVPHEFIIPGGRFREFYYWDAYWIIKGLLASEMHRTVRNMIDNLVYMVKNHGFVPNGGRVYYLQRSQPPFLIRMAFEYYQKTKDLAWLKNNIDTFVQELEFWNKNRAVDVTINNKPYTFYQYRPTSNTPRPEGYLHDIQAAAQINGPSQKTYLQNLAATAESGWDFSTRWYNDSRTMDTIKTTDILPVDLNSYIYLNYRILGYFYKELGNATQAEPYESHARVVRGWIREVFFDEKLGSFFDYHLDTKSLNTLFYASTAAPLFAEAYDLLDSTLPNRVLQYMKSQHVFDQPAGVPTSLINSTEQWDFPNGWANLEHQIVEGLRKSSDPEAQRMAFDLAQKWVVENFMTWKLTKAMWEKYDVSGGVPHPGHGGLYDVQLGFGWSNGVVLDLLMTYGDRLVIPRPNPTNALPTTTQAGSSLPLMSALLILCAFLWVNKE